MINTWLVDLSRLIREAEATNETAPVWGRPADKDRENFAISASWGWSIIIAAGREPKRRQLYDDGGLPTAAKEILSTQNFVNDNTLYDVKLLSQREIEIAKYLKTGLSSKEIAELLFLSLRTVETHRQNILKKLNFKTTASLINFINNTDINFL